MKKKILLGSLVCFISVSVIVIGYQSYNIINSKKQESISKQQKELKKIENTEVREGKQTKIENNTSMYYEANISEYDSIDFNSIKGFLNSFCSIFDIQNTTFEEKRFYSNELKSEMISYSNGSIEAIGFNYNNSIWYVKCNGFSSQKCEEVQSYMKKHSENFAYKDISNGFVLER